MAAYVVPDLGSKLLGFAMIMWVAIVPSFVRKPTLGPTNAKEAVLGAGSPQAIAIIPLRNHAA